MKRPSRLDYAYPVGRVRALERYLVSQVVFREAAEEEDFSSAIKTVFDSGRFSDALVEIRNSRDLDSFLEEEAQWLLTEVKGLFLEKEFLDLLVQENKPSLCLPVALDLGYAFIIDHFRHRIDLNNLKILLRLKYAGLPKNKLASRIMQGGFLESRTLIQNFELSYSEIGERLSAGPYRDLWGASVASLEEQETFVALERGIEDFLMKHTRLARRVVFGPEPVFGYALAKRRELSHIRILAIGKLNRIPSDVLKARLGETYV